MKPNPPEWMPSDELIQMEAQLFPDGFTLRDEANAITAMAFRNGPIEDLHAGKSSELLSNPELSRITDEEMKTVMVNACEHVAKLLELKETDPEGYYRRASSCAMGDGCSHAESIPWGSSTNFLAAPQSKSLYPLGASSRAITVTLTASAI